MKKNWSGRRVRQVLKHWYALDHNFGRLSLNDLKYMEQFYFRMSYLSPREQSLLADLFYYPQGQQPSFTEVASKHHLDYLKFNYTVHKPERKLMKYRSEPNLSLSVVKGIQFQQLADGFRSIIAAVAKKFRAYPQILKLDQAFDEDFGTRKHWPRTKVERILSRWCPIVRRPPKHQRRQIAYVRQLLFRLSYLPKVNYQILCQYYYYPTRQQQKRVRSEHLAQEDEINLGKLLLDRLHGLEQLQQPRYLPKIQFTDDERWQIKNDWQGVQNIIKHSFKH